MFQSLSDRLSGILDKLTRRGSLTDSDVAEAMREVRRALLEADVALEVVRDFTDKVRAKAVGQEVVKSVTPGQMVVKIVHDELVAMLGSDAQPIDLAAQPPVPILLVGLQGSGKTTTCAKIGYRLTNRDKKKVLMASLDVRRPAAQEQLRILGEQTSVDTLPIIAGQTPQQITRRALDAAKLGGYDVVLLDTAGRIHIDEALMQETADVRDLAHPHETLLVADSLTGQDAVKLAKSFNERVGITGIVLTRVDGDGRGGAALSMRAVTGKPIKLIGVGEKWDALEDFHPERIAGRILGMGDVVSLVEKAAQTIDMEKAQAIAAEDAQGRVRPGGSRRSAQADGEARRHVEHAGHAARHRQDEEAARRRQHRRQGAQAPARHHLVDDAQGAAQPEGPRRQAEAPDRRRLRHQARGREPAAQDAPPDGGHDEDDGQARRHDAAHDGHGRRRWRPERGRAREDAGGPRQARPAGAGESAEGAEGPAAPRSAQGRRRRATRAGRRAPDAAAARIAWSSRWGAKVHRTAGEEEVSLDLDIPVLETERLHLRAFREGDLDRYAEFRASETLSRFIGGTNDRRGSWGRIAAYLGHWALRGYGHWAIEEKAGGRFIGYSGLWNPEGWPEPEVIWGLMADAHGRGFATEAARRVREFAYRNLGWRTAVSLIAPQNLPSQRVAQRLGAKHERDLTLFTHQVGVYRHPAPEELHS